MSIFRIFWFAMMPMLEVTLKNPWETWLRGNHKSPWELFVAWSQDKDGYRYDLTYSRSTGCFTGGYTLKEWISDAQTDSERAYRKATAEYLTKIANLPVIDLYADKK